MKTDYTNCHPEIAESLKKGEHIKCLASFDSLEKAGTFIIIAYVKGEYFTAGGHR